MHYSPQSIGNRLKSAVGILLTGWILAGCNVTKYVPDNEYLLYKARVKVVDNKDIKTDDLEDYLRQKQNTEIFGFWKLQLHIYNTAPADTTTKAKKKLAENAHKMGEAPILYDDELTGISMDQITKTMQNKGYFDASVDTIKEIKGKKLSLTYLVTAREPYKINEYRTKIDQPEVARIANSSMMKVYAGDLFNTSPLDQERQRITTAMRNTGHYFFDKDLLEYQVDSGFGHHEVSVEMNLSQYLDMIPDSIRGKIYTKYHIKNVYFHLDYDPQHIPEDAVLRSDSDTHGYIYSYIDKRFIRNKILRAHCPIHPGDLFCEHLLERAYTELNSLAPVKYADIGFEPVEDTLLDCHITLSRNKLNSISAEVEGTYSAGDWGIAAGLGYTNKNLFKGAEQFTLNGRGSYEWRQNGGRAIEAKVEAGLQFPSSVKINIAYNYQDRPEEYTRTIANAGLYYTIPKKTHSRWTHKLNLLDINYVYLPWMSEKYKHDFIDQSSVLKSSYEDHFILDWSYTGSYNGYRANQPNRSYINFTYSIETAGNLLYGISKMANLAQDEAEQYTIWHIPFAQYAKADVNFSYHQILTEKHILVYHAGIGIAAPYLNASTIPFEKRYFAGGSNSVRGWQARTLGPGAFRGEGNVRVYDLQAGDIRLDLNLEYRWKTLSFLELAAFIDAGNIWTIRDYKQQPYGQFKWDEFYRQIAMSYGVGIRFDFSIFIFRIDFGVKLYDPSRLYGSLGGTQWRTAKNGLCWKDDMTLHFAIGYPF